MEEAQSTSSLPPFLVKTYEMVDDPSTAQIVSWSQNNKSFIVWDPPEFAKELLPKYFKHNNFSSFIRQLNTYGFRKVDPEQWEFANDDFVRGQPHLLKNIHRRKPVHSHSLQNVQGQEFSSSSLSDSERQGYKAEIDRLKCDKDSVFAGLQIHKKEQEGINVQVLHLTSRFVHAEQREKEMLHTLARNLQKCGLSFDFLESSFAYERKRRLPRNSSIDDLAVDMDQREIHTLQVVAKESSSVLPLEMIEKLESSLMFWENIMQDMDEVEESANHGDSRAISLMQINVDLGNTNSGIDMNSEPPNPAVRSVADLEEPQVVRPMAVAPSAGANDVFWEQFLTENPGPRDGQEVDSERKDHEGKKSENGKSKSWWNVTSVNYLTEQLGHLSPAERT